MSEKEKCEFQPGDTVRCVMAKDVLQDRATYQVAHVIEGMVRLVEHPGFGWWPCRFEKIESIDELTKKWGQRIKSLEEECDSRQKRIENLEVTVDLMQGMLDEVVDDISFDTVGMAMRRSDPGLVEHIKRLRKEIEKSNSRAELLVQSLMKIETAAYMGAKL